jgi:DNA polymerase
MSDTREILSRAARQLTAIEELLGGSYIPTNRNPLPDFEAPKPAVEAAPAGQGPAELSPDDKAAALGKLDESEVATCTRCRLHEGRTNVVFGEGSPTADLVFIGEGPGHDEDISGRPFVGRAGKLLTKMITAMGLTREDVFICNVVKCRPPNNRTPMPDEVETCWDYLVRQLQIIRPKVIVTLGNPATKAILDTTTGITRMRGSFHPLPDLGQGLAGIPVMPTFHPSYVLRQYTPENRRAVWSDLQQVMDLLGLQVPEK